MDANLEAKMERARLQHSGGMMHPKQFETLHKPRSLFVPGHHLTMNIVALFINLFCPWALFIFTMALTGYRLMYQSPSTVWLVIIFLGILWLAALAVAIQQRRKNPDPTWFSYFVLALLVFGVAGLLCGYQIFQAYTKPYNSVIDLKLATNINPTTESGQNVMDAGLVRFAAGASLDTTRSWHFKHKTIYCVSPIVANQTAPETQSYDFWAVGKDCCAINAADFRCGAWTDPNARGGLRIFDENDLSFYRLAVQQAESTFDIASRHPIFVEWSPDPLVQVESWKREGTNVGLKLVVFAFICSLFFLSLAAARFAFLGRATSEYSTKYYNDPNYSSTDGYGNPIDYQTHGFRGPLAI